MPDIRLTELWRFPVKSLRGDRHRRLAVTPRGFTGDREWMLIDPEGRFLTQREEPRLALLHAGFDRRGLVLDAPGRDEHVVSPAPGAGRMEAVVWRDTCPVQAPDPLADRWLSEFLGQECRLVHLAEDAVRQVDPVYATPRDQVGFADAFPFLLISQGSLDDLNDRLDTPVPMVRFRPNLVVAGCAPYAEDTWRLIRIGPVEFRVAKPCSRCPVPTIDPLTARRSKEPLRTLATYRRRDNQVWFGQNLLHDSTGELAEGMTVEVLETVDD